MWVDPSNGPTHDHLTPAAPRPAADWGSIAQFGLSAITVLSLWGLALVAGALGLSDVLSGQPDDALPTFLVAGGLVLGGLLALPSTWYAGLRLMGRQKQGDPVLPPAIRPTRLIILLPLVLGAGYLLTTRTGWAWLGLPPLHLLAVGLPVFWALYLGVRHLPLGSRQRLWGVFGSGLVLGPMLILMFEIAALMVAVVGASIWLSMQPGLEQELLDLIQEFGYTQQMQERVVEALAPYLSSPLILLAVFSFVAVIVPLIEELLKPVGVWLLAGRELTPAAGFAAGALSGAGYALFESLALGIGSEDWLFVVVARSGTAAVHILTTALTGWGLAWAWRSRAYLRLGLAYLMAVTIHSLWNSLTLVSTAVSVADLFPEMAPLPDVLVRLGNAAPYGLVFLALGIVVVLVLSNRALRKSEAAP